MGIAVTLHLLAATVWVGGLFFAFACLRPAAAELDAAHRVRLWADALALFSRWVWAAIAVLLLWRHKENIGRLLRGEEGRVGGAPTPPQDPSAGAP